MVIYTFGRTVARRRGEASELLQLFFPDGRAESGPQPQVSSCDIDAALTWWSEALDRLFTEVTDPVRYTGDDGTYSVKRNFEALLSIEQVFRNVQSLSAHARNSHVRPILLFDTLDTLEGLRSPDFGRMCESSYAQRALDEVTCLVGPEADACSSRAPRKPSQRSSISSAGSSRRRDCRAAGYGSLTGTAWRE